MKQPALSVGEFLFFCLVIVLFWGGVFIALFVDSIRPASAQQRAEDVLFRVDLPESPAEDERMMRDFGLIPDNPVALSPVRVEYAGAPVQVVLGVGHERRLEFEQPFRFGLEPAVAPHFNLEIYDRYLLITANRAVSTRARVQLSSGQIVPLDILAVTGAGPAGPLEISTAPGDAGESEPETPSIPAAALPHPAPAPGYVDLVRHAAQRLYSPPRLQSERPGLRSVPVIETPVRLIRGVRVESTPIASWEEGGLVITAIRVTNLEKRPIRLDPRQIVGHWRAASFHHGRLRPGDATALYLVSDQPFEASLGIHLHAEEAGG